MAKSAPKTVSSLTLTRAAPRVAGSAREALVERAASRTDANGPPRRKPPSEWRMPGAGTRLTTSAQHHPRGSPVWRLQTACAPLIRDPHGSAEFSGAARRVRGVGGVGGVGSHCRELLLGFAFAASLLLLLSAEAFARRLRLDLLLLHGHQLRLQLGEVTQQLVHAVLLPFDDLLLTLSSGGEQGDEIRVGHSFLVRVVCAALVPHHLRHHGLELVGDEAEAHVLGLAALLEVVGHRPQLPEHPKRSCIFTLLLLGAGLECHLGALSLFDLGLQEVPQGPCEGLDVLLQSAVRGHPGPGFRPGTMQLTASVAHGHDLRPVHVPMQEGCGAVVVHVRVGGEADGVGCPKCVSARQAAAEPCEGSERQSGAQRGVVKDGQRGPKAAPAEHGQSAA
mmetsp:Transcript_47796/g.113878  ORF Transcript_47796/g.113878 Transcript_47796/m.113878 type:complete len:393 (+) Transcript_47796:92-1270(+)